VVRVAGLFIGWLNGTGAFWTILSGLCVGIPIFFLKEVTGVGANLGLPDIHYTIMSSILMLIAIVPHFGLILMTRTDTKDGVDDLVRNRQDATEVFTTLESQLWLDRTLLSPLLVACIGAMIIWFW